MTWTTRLPPERTRRFGVEELHVAWLLPRGFPGRGPVVCLTLPECELKFVSGEQIGNAVIVYTFDRRHNVAHAIKDACRIARDENACLFITADALDQLEPAVRLAAKRLPHHTRAALERIADPDGRVTEKLN